MAYWMFDVYEAPATEGGDPMSDWRDNFLAVPYAKQEAVQAPVLQLIRQDYEKLERNQAILKTPLTIGSKVFQHGLGTHAQSHIRIFSPLPLERITAWIGVDHNDRTRGGQGSISFMIKAEGNEVYRSNVLRGGEEPVGIDLELNGARSIDLVVDDGGDGPACDHADWAEAVIRTVDGKEYSLGEMPLGESPLHSSRYPSRFFLELIKAMTSSITGKRSRRKKKWTRTRPGLQRFGMIHIPDLRSLGLSRDSLIFKLWIGCSTWRTRGTGTLPS